MSPTEQARRTALYTASPLAPVAAHFRLYRALLLNAALPL
eukprot:CAMPEP_0202914518 /NCGR_PEP_ID=MMETSP1392-20130828/63265_1 /ASSEMBLY_ACC=CAM_ASM_000868 /TAXON_ID=225041 /ORGANISM="Chlamydomonas chlamydogama, Strain SAG 11-48b" /LENGTH=39 /DNA_ID= /DNA_START= /DNA_END= /DNA_ORIENTATION=